MTSQCLVPAEAPDTRTTTNPNLKTVWEGIQHEEPVPDLFCHAREHRTRLTASVVAPSLSHHAAKLDIHLPRLHHYWLDRGDGNTGPLS